MQVVILGGAGFIGSHLVEYLLKVEGVRVHVLDKFLWGNQVSHVKDERLKVYELDLNDYSRFFELLTSIKPKRIYHFAANSEISVGVGNPFPDIKNTFFTTLNLVQALQHLECPEVIFASSSAVYAPRAFPIGEDSDTSPISVYGWMKLASERCLLTAHKAGIIQRLLIARFPNVVGQRQTHGVIFDLIKKLRYDSEILEVLGNGEQTKPYVRALDIVRICEMLLGLEWKSTLCVNISTQERCSVKQIVEILCRITGIEPEIKFGTTPEGWEGDVPNYELDTSLLHKLLPGLEVAPSALAIKETIQHLWENSV